MKVDSREELSKRRRRRRRVMQVFKSAELQTNRLQGLGYK